MPDGVHEIDFMGNRAWRNDPEINELFLYQLKKKEGTTIKQRTVGHSTNGNHSDVYNGRPDFYSSTLFAPMVEFFAQAKEKGWKFMSIPVPGGYQHPIHQSEVENRDPNFVAKRDNQREQIYTEVVEEVRRVLRGESRAFIREYVG
jgi:hypothetical protein